MQRGMEEGGEKKKKVQCTGQMKSRRDYGGEKERNTEELINRGIKMTNGNTSNEEMEEKEKMNCLKKKSGRFK